MHDCRKCLFYNAQFDEMRRERDDVVVIGQGEPDRHYCDLFTPIPPGVFEGEVDCESFVNADENQ